MELNTNKCMLCEFELDKNNIFNSSENFFRALGACVTNKRIALVNDITFVYSLFQIWA